MRRLLVVLIASLTAMLPTGISVLVTATPASAGVLEDEFAFFDQVNGHRANVGLPGVTMSAAFSYVARVHSLEMAAAGGIFHSSNLAATIASSAPNWQAGGENVGVGGSVAAIDGALINSPPHRANILGNYNYVGIGVAYSGSLMYVTQIFVLSATPIQEQPRPGSPQPYGFVDAMTRSMADLTIDGWTIDPDTSTAIGVHIYVDGWFAGATTANGNRPDLAGFGRGNAHGFHATVRPGPGLHVVCVYAINDAPGVNPLIECRYVDMVSSPIGFLDAAVQSGSGIVASGWAIDPDSPSSIDVHVYVDSYGVAIHANRSRPDVGNAYPGYGNAHGYSVRVGATPGWHNVCVAGINIGPGGNAWFPCQWVYVA